MWYTFTLYCTLHLTITITYCSCIYNKVLSCIFKISMKKNRNINSCYYREMPNATKKNLIVIKSTIVWKWNFLFMENYFRKKKINIVMDLCPVTFRSFVFQWLAKIAGPQPQLKPLMTHPNEPFSYSILIHFPYILYTLLFYFIFYSNIYQK